MVTILEELLIKYVKQDVEALNSAKSLGNVVDRAKAKCLQQLLTLLDETKTGIKLGSLAENFKNHITSNNEDNQKKLTAAKNRIETVKTNSNDPNRIKQVEEDTKLCELQEKIKIYDHNLLKDLKRITVVTTIQTKSKANKVETQEKIEIANNETVINDELLSQIVALTIECCRIKISKIGQIAGTGIGNTATTVASIRDMAKDITLIFSTEQPLLLNVNNNEQTAFSVLLKHLASYLTSIIYESHHAYRTQLQNLQLTHEKWMLVINQITTCHNSLVALDNKNELFQSAYSERVKEALTHLRRGNSDACSKYSNSFPLSISLNFFAVVSVSPAYTPNLGRLEHYLDLAETELNGLPSQAVPIKTLSTP